MPQKLIRLSNLMYWISTVLMVAVPMAVLAYLLVVAPGPSDAPKVFPNIDVSQEPSRLWFFVAYHSNAIGFAIFCGFLWQLRQLFGLYRHGHVLTIEAARKILSLGKWLLALGIVRLLTTPFQSLILTLENPPGTRAIAISVSDQEVGFLLAAGLLTLIGWAMTEAVHVADENKAFV